MNKFKSGRTLPNIGIIGATGLVGRTFLKVLEERKLPYANLFLFASERSAGESIKYKGKDYKIDEAKPDIFENLDIALFSAGGSASMQLAPYAQNEKCVVIDNSSAWRMHPDVPLIVPEVNPNEIYKHNYIIANPNCSTIQLVVALKPISDKFGIKRVICSTYQSISGAGQKGIDKLQKELTGNFEDSKPIAFNTLFHQFEKDSRFTNEEVKMINETRKIMNLPELPVAVTCVRLPTIGGHAESVNLELYNNFELQEIFDLLENAPGIKLIDNSEKEEYPTPFAVNNSDLVYVGRIRKDETVKNGLYLWIVADNVRKGAASNAVQIAELLINSN